MKLYVVTLKKAAYFRGNGQAGDVFPMELSDAEVARAKELKVASFAEVTSNVAEPAKAPKKPAPRDP